MRTVCVEDGLPYEFIDGVKGKLLTRAEVEKMPKDVSSAIFKSMEFQKNNFQEKEVSKIPEGFEEFIKAIRERVADGKIKAERKEEGRATVTEDKKSGRLTSEIEQAHQTTANIKSIIDQLGMGISARFHGHEGEKSQELAGKCDGVVHSATQLNGDLEVIYKTLCELNHFLVENL